MERGGEGVDGEQGRKLRDVIEKQKAAKIDAEQTKAFLGVARIEESS